VELKDIILVGADVLKADADGESLMQGPICLEEIHMAVN
jgi:hypothetical protein